MRKLELLQHYFVKQCDYISNMGTGVFTLPYLTPDGDNIQVYVFEARDHFLICDDGKTFQNLFNENGIIIDNVLWKRIQPNLDKVQYHCKGSLNGGHYNNFTIELVRELPKNCNSHDIVNAALELGQEINHVYQEWYGIIKKDVV